MNKGNHPESSGYVGIRDIAKLAGVSTTTVSRVINDPEMASGKVGKKVQKVIEKYSYTSSQPVKKIFSKANNTTAMFIYDMKSPFFISLVKELNQICLEHSYMLLTYDTGNNPELEKKYFYFCLANRYAGTTLTKGIDSDTSEACRIHTPIAFLDRRTHGKLSSIRSNNRQMMQSIVDCLYNLGHRKIAFVGCETPMDSAISRQNDYIEAMAGKGLPIIQECTYDRSFQLALQVGSRALSYFLSLPIAPMIIICYNDVVTLGALDAAYPLGLKILADTSIVGFDNVISNLHQPQITTVQQNLRDISLELFRLVVNPPGEPVFKIVEASFTGDATCSRVEAPQK